MKCEEAIRNIDAYIAGTLPRKEMHDFIMHVKNCPECYDELETYYTISEGIRFLETGNPISYNIPKMLCMDLENKQRRIRRFRLVHVGMWIGVSGILLLGILAMTIL